MRFKELVLVFVVFFAFVIVQCGERGRSNPFDPATSQVENVLEMRLESNDAQIIVRWEVWRGPDIEGYNIYRAEVPGELSLISQVDNSVNSYTDTDNITVGNQYTYGISARSSDGETYITGRDTISTGNTRWWVLSHDFSPLSVLSHDGLHRNASFGVFQSPTYIAGPADESYVYVHDNAGGRIFRQDVGGSTNLFLDEIRTVRNMYFDESNNTIYVARDEFQHEDFNIFFQALPSGGEWGYSFPALTDTDFTPAGSIWISHDDSLAVIPSFGNTSRNYLVTGGGRAIDNIEIYHRTSDLLIFLALADNSIVKYSANEKLDEITGVLNPVQMKYNPNDGSLWILSTDPATDRYSVFRYDENGIEEIVSGLVRVLDIEVNPLSNKCLVPDYGDRKIYLLSPDGSIRSKADVAGRVYEVFVQTVRGG